MSGLVWAALSSLQSKGVHSRESWTDAIGGASRNETHLELDLSSSTSDITHIFPSRLDLGIVFLVIEHCDTLEEAKASSLFFSGRLQKSPGGIVLTLSKYCFPSPGSVLVPGPLKTASKGWGIFVCLLAVLILDSERIHPVKGWKWFLSFGRACFFAARQIFTGVWFHWMCYLARMSRFLVCPW